MEMELLRLRLMFDVHRETRQHNGKGTNHLRLQLLSYGDVHTSCK
jgi:hypothetical protein